MANSADPDQLASSEANWSGSTLFAKASHICLGSAGQGLRLQTRHNISTFNPLTIKFFFTLIILTNNVHCLPFHPHSFDKSSSNKNGYVQILFFFFVCFIQSLSTIFQSYREGVWMWQGAQCSLLECCLTEISCPRYLTRYSTQSHYTDTELTSSDP